MLQFYIVTLPIPYLSGSTVITFFNDISRFFNVLCIIDVNREYAQNFRMCNNQNIHKRKWWSTKRSNLGLSPLVWSFRGSPFPLVDIKWRSHWKLRYFHFGCDNWSNHTEIWDIVILGSIIVKINMYGPCCQFIDKPN